MIIRNRCGTGPDGDDETDRPADRSIDDDA
jgi:hypothetical protein